MSVLPRNGSGRKASCHGWLVLAALAAALLAAFRPAVAAARSSVASTGG